MNGGLVFGDGWWSPVDKGGFSSSILSPMRTGKGR